MLDDNKKNLKKTKTSSRRKFIKGAVATTGLAMAASTLAAPAIAQSKVEAVMVATWPKNLPGLDTGARRFAQRVEAITDGRIKINYYSAGERVGAFDVFDIVGKGDAQIYHGAEYYWTGKEKSFGYFCSVPMGLTYTEFNSWMRFAGGQQLWDELSGKFNIKPFMCGNTGVQMQGWFRKEINTPEDLKGLKMRIPGVGGQMMSKLGVSVVNVPGGQIYEQLMSGAIDATEWVGPWNDEALKFYEAAKFYYYPGVHEPGSMLSIGVNKSWLTSLSKLDQLLIETAATAENEIMMSEFNAKNGEALKRLVNNHGVQLRRVSDRIYDAFGKAAKEVDAENEASSDIAKRVVQSFHKARAELGAWNKIADQAYVAQRNRVLGI
ncbi:MAG: twin-arginine translocation signal domain-containing protein [Alphaproteobacteria bacterium]|jgi:TRAP-type mannitol/chloroaromatic compound transport system substrate-binding protein|nr:twin-arginine translocation signal domain-containing protein [Alphaproteobacteria bacterium]